MDKNSIKQELLDFIENQEELPIEELSPPESDVATRMSRVTHALLSCVDKKQTFATKLGQIIRDAVDYVIDAPTLHRYRIEDLEPDEKTAIGKRIERLMRFEFGFPRGEKLDLHLANEEVDIKTTLNNNWMFSRSSHGHINLLLAYDEGRATFKLGLAHVSPDKLGAKNRDQKQSLTAAHRGEISWIFENVSYPENFLATLPSQTLKSITQQSAGTLRVAQLFRFVKERPIPRHAICSVANQKDPLKRVRSNGGARDIVWRAGILVLAGTSKADKQVALLTLGVRLEKDQMISIDANNSSLSAANLELYRKSHNLPMLVDQSNALV